MNIERFKSEVDRSGLAHSGFFQVTITPPQGIPDRIVEARGLQVRTDSVTLPGRSMATIDNYFDYGQPRRIPYTATHGDVSMSIICSEDMREKEFFDKWQDLIVGTYRNGNLDDEKVQFDVGYYDDYTRPISIERFTPTGQPVYKITLTEAYPVFVNPIEMSWDSADALRLNIAIAYRYFIIDQATNKRTRVGFRNNGSLGLPDSI